MFTKRSVKITTGFSLKGISLLTALVLLSPAALPANSTVVPKGVSTEPLNINYTRTDSASVGGDTLVANFCHTRADELKIRVIPAPGMKVGTDTRMTLTITGNGHIKSYAVFTRDSPVSPTKTNANAPADYYPAAEAAKDVYITRDFVKPWVIKYAEDVHGKWDPVSGKKPGDSTGTQTVFHYNGKDKPAEYSQKKIPDSARGTMFSLSLFPAPQGISSGTDHFSITGGRGYELTSNNRNILSIELKIDDHNSSQVMSWSAEKGSNNMRYSVTSTSGAKIFKSAPAVDKKNDPYATFYQDAISYFRGTLALMNGEYTEYMNKKMPLSLNSKSQGKLNLVNMEELIFTLGGKPGAYTVSVEGQPLKFVPLYVNGAEKISAMKIRRACK